MLTNSTSTLWKLLFVLLIFFSFRGNDIQASPTINLGTENTAGSRDLSAGSSGIWNFRISAAAGSLMRIDKSYFRLGKNIGTTEPITFTIYSGLGGNTGGNAVVAQVSLTPAQVDNSVETEELFSFAEQLLLAGDYSITLTTNAPDAASGYSVKLGRLAVYDTSSYLPDGVNSLLSSVFWIQDARDAGDADANFNTQGGQAAGSALMVADVSLFNGATVLDPALSDDQGAAVDFGSMTAGGTIDRVFTLRNDGAGGMSGIAVSFAGTHAAQFSLQSAPASTLAAGGVTNFTVRFQSAAALNASAQLLIASNDPDENPFNLPLTARAQSVPVISDRLAVTTSSTAATLTAKVNPGGAATSVRFQYSTSAAFDVGLVTTAVQNIGSSTALVNVSASISGLNASTVYYWRVVATNSLNTTTSTGLALLKVSMMPSYTQNPTYANALINTSINVWGRVWGGTAPFTYRMSYGDGSTDITGAVSNVKYITAPHTFTTSGSKTVTLTVTDATGASASRSSVVRVLPSVDLDEKSNIAIEKALVYLYNSAIEQNSDRIYWYQPNTDYGFGTTGASVLAFEEQGHLPGNDSVEWVYTDTVRRGLNTLLGIGAGTNYGAMQNIADHSDGIAVRDVDEDNDGKGAYLWNGGHGTYVNSFAGMAVIFAYRNPAAAQASIIPSGPFINMSYYDVVIDLLDTFKWCMGDGAVRGGYEYTVTATTGSRYDGSSQQWPVLCYKAGLDRLKITPPSWYLDNVVYGFKQMQNANGGLGYSSNTQWVNTAKTGGLLTGMAFSGLFQGTTEVDTAFSYIQTYWDADRNGNSSFSNSGWAGNWYAMYGIKKGLTLQNINNVIVGGISRDWKKEMTAWLLGEASYLPATLSPSYRTANDMFGQQSDGRWISQDWPSSTSYNDLSTAHGVLILSASVTQAPPVPVISEVGEQSNKVGFRSFNLSASGSYHLDPDRAIVEYLWDWNAADGLNWTTPDATGAQVTNPGYATTGTYTVTLRVKDNNDPALTKTSTVQVTVVATDVAPVAVALPLGGFQGYAGKVGVPITLNGSNSYDPDGDVIESFSWDLNGDGIYGDATGVTVTVTYNSPYVGSLGLRVTANGKTSNNTAVVDIQAADADISLDTVTLSNVVPRTSADFSIQISNDPGSGQSFNNVVLRIYNGNPYAGGGPIGLPYLVNLPSGLTTTVNLTGVNLGGATSVWVYLDSTQAVIEANEANNASGPYNVDQLPADITVQYPVGTSLISGTSTVVIPEVVLAGQSGTPVTFTVRNDGEANLENLVITKAGTNPADFTVSALGSTTVAGASFTTFTLTFTPTGYLGGIRSAVLQIASNDPNENPFLIAVQAKARLTVIPVAKDAGKDIVTENPVKGADGVSEIGLYDILRRGGFVAENGVVVFPGSLIVGSGSPAVTVNNSQGVWKAGTTGDVWMIARTGETVPDVAGSTFDYLPIVPGINEDGEVTLLASLRIGVGGVTSANDVGVWSEIGGSPMQLLAREGDAVPGLPGVFISRFCAGVYATAKTAADKGDAMYSVTFGGASTTTAIVRNRVDRTLGTVSMQVVARENSPAPGTAENFGNLMGSFSDPARMDGTGNAVFAAMTKTNKEGIWYHAVGNTGAPVRAVFTGDVAPGTGGATFSRIQRPTMGSNSVISFRGLLNRNGDNTGGLKGDGIWRGSAATGTYTCVLRSGDSGIAGMPVGSKVGNTWGGWLTNQNHGAWKTWLDVNGDGVSKAPTDVHALFTDVSGTMRMVVKVGDAAPGITGATFSSLEIPMVGGQEQMIFLGKVTGPGIVAGVNDKGLWRQESNGGELELVLRSGDPLGTTLHGMKTVSTIDFPGSDTTSTTDRRWEQLVIDGDGNIVVLIVFTDGSTSQAMVPAGL